MNASSKKIIKNISHTVSSNLVSLIISVLVNFIVPKIIGVSEFGYWQLYLFYSSYIAFLNFGWNDGIYLKYGGKKYEELDSKLLFSQFYMIVFTQIIIAVIIYVFSDLYIVSTDRLLILKMVGLCSIVVNSRYMLLFILLATDRITEYAKITRIDRVIYGVLIVLFIYTGIRNYKVLIIADLIGKLISLFIAVYYCRDIVIRKINTFRFTIREGIDNIKIGSNLMLANIASTSIIGFVRFGIERSWGVETFGKVSLTLSISSFFMLFINSIGAVFYPLLRRAPKEKLPDLYSVMRNILMVLLFGILIAYYPMRYLISQWLPQYSDSLIYMSILFPILVYEGKTALLINTYLKTLRKEKVIMVSNIVTLILSLVVTLFNVFILKSLNIIILSILGLLMFRSVFAEIALSRVIRISVKKKIFIEISTTIIFVWIGLIFNNWFSVPLYLLIYLIYLYINKKDIKKAIQDVKLLI